MLPSPLTFQLIETFKEYVNTTFPMANEPFKDSIKDFINNDLIKEPYISLGLDFRSSNDFYSFPNILKLCKNGTEIKPYVHQKKAFDRIIDIKSTIIATGTGSGKTECYLYPIIDYCYKEKKAGHKGIKAIIIYPMNALASDQSARIAEIISSYKELHGTVIAGRYVGADPYGGYTTVNHDDIISNHETLLENPPDILVTNYKMLDLLLLRKKDSGLWKNNDSQTLKYIVVDELHTFDGAQGTDLACLLRRLKGRLNTPKEHLCCIGTSATIGSNPSKVKDYAQSVFDENFDTDSLVEEDRLLPSEFFKSFSERFYSVPTDVSKLKEYIMYSKLEEYIKEAVFQWFGIDNFDTSNKILLGEYLRQHKFFRDLLNFTKGKNYTNSEIISNLISYYPKFNSFNEEEKSIALDALYALISYSRKENDRPLLSVSVTLWLKEMRRIISSVDSGKINLYMDVNSSDLNSYLPIVNCRECGATAWATIHKSDNSVSIDNIKKFYSKFFSKDFKDLVLLFPNEERGTNEFQYLCPKCLHIEATNTCSHCSNTDLIKIAYYGSTAGMSVSKDNCPICGTHGSLSLVGMRNTSEISSVLSPLYSSPFNDDKKVMAFSDNVQDSSHKAGFFNHKTYRFGFRSAVASSLVGSPTMADFEKEFPENLYKNSACEEEFVYRYTAPNMSLYRIYDNILKGNKGSDIAEFNKNKNEFIRKIKLRLKYDFMLEVGLLSNVGRTLYKSHVLSLEFPNDIINNIADKIKADFHKNYYIPYKEKLIKEAKGDFHKALIDVLEKLACVKALESCISSVILGILNNMRRKGAFYDNVFKYFLEDSAKYGYKNRDYLLTHAKVSYLPGKTKQNIPVFPYNTVSCHPFQNDDYKKIFYAYTRDADIINKLSVEIFEGLVKEDLIKNFSGTQYWGLNKEKIIVSNTPFLYECEKCHRNVHFAQANDSLVNNIKICPYCQGELKNKSFDSSYYTNLYKKGDDTRIKAIEHNSLLDNKKRNNIEESFKGTKTWDYNLLSCTPTMEMGIDIGSLSGIIMCNVPNTSASYIQRKGRGGRKDGNSLTLTIANAKSHDRYFFEEPLEMVEGNVEAPLMFMNASHVIERQLIAYCMDRWIQDPTAIVPDTISTCLNNDKLFYDEKIDSSKYKESFDLSKLDTKTRIFPYNFLEYISINQNDLFNDFKNIFNLDPSIVTELHDFFFGNKTTEHNIITKIIRVFLNEKAHLDSFINLKNNLDTAINTAKKSLGTSYKQEEIDQMEEEKDSIVAVIVEINNKNTYGFLTDESILPNYAFPEEGATLKAIVARKEEDAENEEIFNDDPNITITAKKKRISYSYNRASSAAIRDFAPLNSFYIDGHRHIIDRVDIKSSEIEKWRLCPKCSHAEKIYSGIPSDCPKCGASWDDVAQEKEMIKMKTVFAESDYKSSIIGDSEDHRSNNYYVSGLYADPIENDTVIYKLVNTKTKKDEPFGFAYNPKMTIREINFGEMDTEGKEISIAGKKDFRNGFKICTGCGKIKFEYTNSKEKNYKHTRECPYKTDDKDAYTDCLFLFREFNTEALRVIIPFRTGDKNKTDSFVAAFMLGIKNYYGNIDHLKYTISTIPEKSTGDTKQYLVIYDTIPGGTGYLKSLTNKDEFVNVLKIALGKLNSCSCSDGCYHCLFGFKNVTINDISRKSAIGTLKDILKPDCEFEKINNFTIIGTGYLSASPLEDKFIDALKGVPNSELEPYIKGSVDCYKFIIHKDTDPNNDIIWLIEPQVDLKEDPDVNKRSIPDFLFIPIQNAPITKSIAVFCDGYEYHFNKSDDDTVKRMAILRSDKYYVWTVSWDDLESYVQKYDFDKYPIYKEKKKNDKDYWNDINEFNKNSFDLFIDFLCENMEHKWTLASKKLSQLFFGNQVIDKSEIEDLCKKTEIIIPLNYEVFILLDINFTVPYIISKSAQKYPFDENTEFPLVFVILDDNNLGDPNYKVAYNYFWHLFNIMQFNNYYVPITQKAIDSGKYKTLTGVVVSSSSASKWLDLDVDDRVKDLIEKLSHTDLPLPEVGFDITDHRGVIATAELAWEDKKVCLLLDDNKLPSDTDWKIIDVDTNIEIIRGLLHV